MAGCGRVDYVWRNLVKQRHLCPAPRAGSKERERERDMSHPSPSPSAPRLCLIRHAPALTGGRLAGRRDVDADCSDRAHLDRLRCFIDSFAPARIWTSPARRCLQTCAALGLTAQVIAALPEQDFGAWEGMPLADLPDLGPLSTADLARHRPPDGESFADVIARIRPLLASVDSPTLVIGHAGTVRAALSLVVGDAALSFGVDPLSTTMMRRAGDLWSVQHVNQGGVS